jgi:hypothetical protein
MGQVVLIDTWLFSILWSDLEIPPSDLRDTGVIILGYFLILWSDLEIPPSDLRDIAISLNKPHLMIR